ncbi:MAG TPA: hypothetical protein DCY91_05360 [Cyanobacteria bacterium UBA11370]|nr:hypothetical protein [Cyanobacteria bacterium UBA11370]HBY79823.1 hypothetical protein [Cyanobacteria bacterium UBA11148]
MNRPELRIPEDKAEEVFTLAAELYAQHNQSYSVNELMEAGAEAKIPPEFIQQAINQIQLQHSPKPMMSQTQGSKSLLIGFVIGLPVVIGLGLMGWLLPKNAPTEAAINAPRETVNPATQVSHINQAGNFKCEGLNLERKDLRGENFRNADCTRGKLAGVNLSGVSIENANLSGADLRNANLSGANLKNANLTEANLAGVNLNGANLENANLSKTDLSKANLRNTTLRQTNFAEATLEDATLDLMSAKKNGVNFNNATLPDGTTHP